MRLATQGDLDEAKQQLLSVVVMLMQRQKQQRLLSISVVMRWHDAAALISW